MCKVAPTVRKWFSMKVMREVTATVDLETDLSVFMWGFLGFEGCFYKYVSDQELSS